MKAMILAAGRGERMRPLTDTTPKPLLTVGGDTLIDRHLRALAAAGFTDVVINVAWLGDLIRDHVGDGSRLGIRVAWSDEGTQALETAGGIRRALPQLGTAPFVVINADIWTDHPLAALRLPRGCLAQLVLVDNPPQHPGGDFAVVDGIVDPAGAPRLTFSGIGVYAPDLFRDLADGPARLAPLLRSAARHGRVGAEHYTGAWYDIGTPGRLARLEAILAAGPSADRDGRGSA